MRSDEPVEDVAVAHAWGEGLPFERSFCENVVLQYVHLLVGCHGFICTMTAEKRRCEDMLASVRRTPSG